LFWITFFGPQNQAGAGFPHRSPKRTLAFHTYLLVLAQQVEIWFARIEREVIARGVFSSVVDLARKLQRYIHAYSAHAKPFKWKYSDPTRHIGNVRFATGH
jgi:hypothetical protein